MCGVRCAVYGVRCAVYGVRCAVCGVRCAAYSYRCDSPPSSFLLPSQVLRSEDPALQFDAILDCTGEASKCVGLLRGGGGLVSILAGPTATALRTWMEEAQLDPSTITCGVRPFLFSGCGT